MKPNLRLTIVKKGNCDCPKDADGKCACDRLLAGPVEKILKELYVHGAVHGVTREALEKDDSLKKFQVPVPNTRRLLLTQDHFVCADEYSTMIKDNLRTVSNFFDSPDPAHRAQGSEMTIPPFGVRKVCPSLLSDETIREEIKRMNSLVQDLDLVSKQIHIDLSKPDYSDVQAALNISLQTMRKPYKQLKNEKLMPYQYEHIITECKSGRRTIKTVGYSTTVLEGIAHAARSSLIGNFRLIGSTENYMYGTNMIHEMDGGGMVIWPDERTMTRVVINVGDAIWQEDYIGFTVKSRLDRALRGLLTSATPMQYDYDGEIKGQRICEAAVYIDSLADVVSTMYNAFTFKDNEEHEYETKRERDGESYAFNQMEHLSKLGDKRIDDLFAVLLEAGKMFLREEASDATLLLLKTHLLASAQDIVKYRSPKRKFLQRLVSGSRVIQELRQLRGRSPLTLEELPYTGTMKKVYLKELLEEANKAISKKVKGFRIPVGSPHAHASRTDGSWRAVQADVRLAIGAGITVTAGQVDLLGERQKRAVSTMVERGAWNGSVYKLELSGKRLNVFRCKNILLETTATIQWEGGDHVVSEAVNRILRGDCDVSSARWVLAGILNGEILVHDSSKASYIPAGARRDEVGLPVVDVALAPFVVRGMAAVVDGTCENLWLVASEVKSVLGMRVSHKDGKFIVEHDDVPRDDIRVGRVVEELHIW